MDSRDHSDAYKPAEFLGKVVSTARTIGRTSAEKLLVMYHALRDSDTPTWAKTTLVAALGYYVFPLDAIPDFIPIVGYSDDFMVVAGALATVAYHIKPEHKERARAQAAAWFD